MDTDKEAWLIQIECFKRMTPTERIKRAMAMTMAAREIARAGIRNCHPNYNEDQVKKALFRMLYGDDLYAEVYPNHPMVAI